ncbi:LCP family protein [Plantactinospora siamensis]|uniref:LCP family protein n=1 Tax=Plantactinospora siamensis TaxID=555372 RepID=A0ABV6NRI9_9ACTN
MSANPPAGWSGDDYPPPSRGVAGRSTVPVAAGRGRIPRPASGDRDVDPGPGYGHGRGGPGGPGGPGWPGDPAGRRRRPRWGRIALVAVLVLALVTGLGVWLYARNLDSDVKRVDPFSAITAGRPAKTVSGAFNILLVGSDSRDPDAPVDGAGKWRSDTIILMHVPASHDKAYLVSIPRDLYVPIPQNASADCGTGQREKINAAFAFGGLPLAVRTVECVTDVRIDHVMAIDFAGFKEVTDALGGVDLKVDQSITSIHKPYRKFTKGMMHMDGATALDWVRQRKQFAQGDFARVRHQQEFLRALMDKAASTGTLANPAKLTAFLNSVTKAVTVDKDLSLVDMGVQFRNLRGNNLTFITSPNLGGQTINGESVVVSDKPRALAMYQAMAADRMEQWVSADKQSGTGTNGG